MPCIQSGTAKRLVGIANLVINFSHSGDELTHLRIVQVQWPILGMAVFTGLVVSSTFHSCGLGNSIPACTTRPRYAYLFSSQFQNKQRMTELFVVGWFVFMKVLALTLWVLRWINANWNL